MKIDVALKEWAIVCDFLAEGRCALLLRKGGIHEAGGPGRFALSHDRFLMFPAWEHERLDWIKTSWRAADSTPDLTVIDEPGEAEPSAIRFRCYAEVGKIWEVSSRSAFDVLDDLHPWDKPQIDMRFDYKPDRPLYVLALRVYRMREPAMVPNRDAFAGCVSWVALGDGDGDGDSDGVEVSGAEPAMSDERFAEVVRRVERAFGVG